MNLYEGVWTPNARVLCMICHGPLFGVRALLPIEHEHRCRPLDATPDGCAVTRCDLCTRRVALTSQIAHEHELVLALREAFAPGQTYGSSVSAVRMEQTGGMCSAAAVYFADWRYVFVTEREDAPGFNLGLYASRDDEEGRNVGAYDTAAAVTTAIVELLTKKERAT